MASHDLYTALMNAYWANDRAVTSAKNFAEGRNRDNLNTSSLIMSELVHYAQFRDVDRLNSFLDGFK